MTPDTNSPAIELINVSRRFLTPDGKSMTALRDFNMSVARGEFVAVVGPTGCGKSTTLNLVTGLAKPSAGEVRVMGAPVDGIDPRIGFVFQTDALFPWRSVIDNVVAGPLFRGMEPEPAYAAARDWLARVNLSMHATKYPHQLSGGMRKRVGLARAIIYEPQIVLYDEPTTGLDPIVSDSIDKLIIRVRDQLKVTSIVVTHDMRSARRVGNRVMMLHEKKLYANATPAEFFASTDPIVRQFVDGVADEKETLI